MERDLVSSVMTQVGVNSQAIATDTTTVGNIIDSSGFESLTFALVTGGITDGDYALVIEDGEDAGLADAAPVDPLLLINALPSFTEDTDDNLSLDIGYVGKKRYVRASIVSTNVTTGGTLMCLAIRGHAGSRPTAA